MKSVCRNTRSEGWVGSEQSSCGERDLRSQSLGFPSLSSMIMVMMVFSPLFQVQHLSIINNHDDWWSKIILNANSCNINVCSIPFLQKRVICRKFSHFSFEPKLVISLRLVHSPANSFICSLWSKLLFLPVDWDKPVPRKKRFRLAVRYWYW